MGRTLDTFTAKIDQTRADMTLFRRALRREDQSIFDALFASARAQSQAGSYLSPVDPFPVILLCMLLEEKKSRISLEDRLHALECRVL